MTPSIGLGNRQSAGLALSPHLQRSLELLKTPAQHLEAVIEQTISTNFALERLDREDEPIDLGDPPDNELIEDPGNGDEQGPIDAMAERLASEFESVGEYLTESSTPQSPLDGFEDRTPVEKPQPSKLSLREHLLDQLKEINGTPWADVEYVVDHIDERGYFVDFVGEEQKYWTVMYAIQKCDPIGCGHFCEEDSLLFQYFARYPADSRNSMGAKLIWLYRDSLINNNLTSIAQREGISIRDVQAAAARLKGLRLYPGLQFKDVDGPNIEPDIRVTDNGKDLVVETNDEYIPRIGIIDHVRKLLKNPEVPTTSKQQILATIKDGKLFMKSLADRQSTLLKLGKALVKYQAAALRGGYEYLRPMTMRTIADEIGVHETTISRAVADKYIETPCGLLEMRKLFTAALQHETGVNVSNASVKSVIANIIARENKRKPFSDNVLVDLLADRGISVARRTITKYRLELGIPAYEVRRTI